MACMQSDRSKQDPKLPAPCALWPVDLRLTQVDCDELILSFQGQYVTICELDYNILQVELQNAQKAAVSVQVGDFCLVEDVRSGRWYRGRVQDQAGGLVDVFLLDHGKVLRAEPGHLSSVSDALLTLPPKIVCGFVANVLPLQKRWDGAAKKYFSSLMGGQIKGYIHGLLPNKVLILEVPKLTRDVLQLRLGRHVDTETFLFLVELLKKERIQQSCESVPDLLLQKQITQDMCFKPSSLCLFESILSLGGSKLAAGEKMRVRISAAVKPGLFYCQSTCAVQTLSEMSYRLEKVCESESYSRGNPGKNMGLLCAVKGKDERWHRGVIQCLPVNSRVRIAFVDDGYCDTVKAENVIQLPPDFFLTPILTFPCSLSCLDQDDEDETKIRQLLLLRDGLLGDELQVTVEGFSNDPNVYSVSLSSVREDRPRYCPETRMKTVPLNDLRDSSVFEGYVEHVQSPTDFWMRTAQSNKRFEAMMSKLSDRFGRLQLHEDVLPEPEPGLLCCAMYEKDLHYYRAQVVRSLENGAEVFFIDFGNTEKVPGMLIKKLPQEFRTEPAFAFSCSLAHVAPLEDVWTAVATKFFRKATFNKTLLAHVVHQRSTGQTVVDLHEQGMERSESVALMMAQHDLALYWKCIPNTAPPVGRMKEKKKAENGLVRIPQRNLTKRDVDTDKNGALLTFKYQKFQPGSEIRVCCSHVETPSDFWCQNLKLKSDLDALMERLQSFYGRLSPVFVSGSVCCAVRLPRDGRWYRGCARTVKTGHAQVVLVDYGVTVKEELQNLRELAPEFVELEAQAFRCSLYNMVEPVGESVWSQEACALFKDFILGRNLTCKILAQFSVLNRGLYNVADLYTPVQRVTSYLVEKGVAVRIQSPKPILSSAAPLSFVYSSFNIVPGSEELVHCTHVVNPWEIYVQLDRNTRIIDQILKRSAEIAEELSAQVRPGPDRPGAMCLARYFGDCSWYRAFVRPAQSSLHCNVYFVDFGNKQVSENGNVLMIPVEEPDLLFTPMQALRCRLSGVPEEENQAEVNAWLEKNVLNKELKAKFVSSDHSGHFFCEMFKGDVSVNEKVKVRILMEKSQTSTKGKNKFVNKNVKTPNLQKLQNQSGVKENPKNKPAAKQAWARTPLPKLSDLPSAKISPGLKKVAFISHCDSTQRFFIQMEEDEQRLLNLGNDLNGGSRKGVGSQVQIGDLVAAEYDEDQALYRAAIVSLSPGAVTVEFIDYGNTASMDKGKLYVLTDRFLLEARFSLSCTLSKSYQDRECFLQRAQGKALWVEFVRDLGQAWEVKVELLSLAPLDESASAKSKPNGSIDERKWDLQPPEIKGTASKLVHNVRSKCKRRSRPSPKIKRVHKGQNEPSSNEHVWTCLNSPGDPIRRLSYAPVQTDQEYVGVAASVTTPGEFCLTLDHLFLTMIDISYVLEGLTQLLPVLPESQLVLGAACLLRDDRKQKWCRAEILSSDPTSVLLNLVDYGHCTHLERSDLHKLRALPEQLAALPKITYPCRLRGIKPAGEQHWSDRAVIFFQEMVCQKDLHIYFRQFVSEAQWEVDIVIEGRKVAKELVDAGHATYVDAVLGIRFQQSLGWGPTVTNHNLQQTLSEEHSPETKEHTSESRDDPGLVQEPRHGAPQSGLKQCLLM